MKIVPVALLCILIQMIFLPVKTAAYAREGLLIWYHGLLPSLFPFMIISGIIVRTKLFPVIFAPLHPVCNRLFHLSPACEYVILTGFLCGFPMGAVNCVTLHENKQISSEEANLLLSFCNNLGPAYFFGFLLPLLPGKLYPVLIIGMYLVPFLYGILLRYTIYRKRIPFYKPVPNSLNHPPKTLPLKTNATSPDTVLHANDLIQAIDDSVASSVTAILKLGAYIVIFHSLRAGLFSFPLPPAVTAVLNCLIEISYGLKETVTTYLTGNPAYLYLLVLIHPGGLCCLLQTLSCFKTQPRMLNNKANMKISSIKSIDHQQYLKLPCDYLLHKWIQAGIWLILLLIQSIING